MSSALKKEMDVWNEEPRGSDSVTDIREVQNVALADATARAGVSAWTPSMFKVRSGLREVGALC